jgi:hypothetical protein
MTYEDQYEEETGVSAKVDISHNNIPWLVNSDAYVEWLKWIATSTITELDIEHRRRVAAEAVVMYMKSRRLDGFISLNFPQYLSWQSIIKEAGE